MNPTGRFTLHRLLQGSAPTRQTARVATTLLAGLAVGLGSAAPAAAETVITGPGVVIKTPGKYRLGNDITVAFGGIGIDIQASNVELDLGNHAVVGPGSEIGGRTQGILVEGNSVHINNGTLRGLAGAVDVVGGSATLNGLAVIDNITGISVLASNCKITDCSFIGNDSAVETSGSDNSVTGSTFTGGTYAIRDVGSLGPPIVVTLTGNNIFNTVYGIHIEAGSNLVILGNTISSTKVGISLDAVTNSTLRGNNTSNNYTGFLLGPDASGNHVSRNESDHNQIQVSGGMTSGGLGFSVAGSYNILEGNTANNNANAGFLALAGATGNTFKNNTANADLIGIGALAGATGNTFKNNTARSSIFFDLDDNNPKMTNCVNTWMGNVFVKAGGIGSGCIR